ncbi:MAG: tetratricopeptide repeat protein [Candidatus Thorarchaeota archaeon]
MIEISEEVEEEDLPSSSEGIPDDAWALFFRGIAARKKKDNPDAIEFYQKAIEIYPKFHQAWNNLGYAFMDEGRMDKAIEAFEEAVAIKPDYHKALHSLSEAYWKKGTIDDLDRGMKYLVKALEIKPSYTLAKKDLEKFQARLEKAREIEEQHTEVTKMIRSLRLRIKNLPGNVDTDGFLTDLGRLQGAYTTEIERYLGDIKEEADKMHDKTWFQRNKQGIIVVITSLLSGLFTLIAAIISKI